ncbi:unconventional myosin-XVIIIa isoform X1 [Diorhabda carinulata]|uniref:unconventional myosin-XVIIIa isoform X1 n=1 Tax=Diorhabda carinulata TaxID=1163345 RepID=UPI0025A202E4|nr:unconventional myosin-XVIIIa isoform X1 [Diorhabda carinulata]XP_057663670.1 unconventional myosin-XVIIIa isoform X1 [Diorhabda carinulata]
MFNFIKKATVPGVTSDKDDKEKRKRDKKDRKEKQKRERANMSAEELLRLDEVRRSLKIRGRRKDKEKLPSGITADYTADFLASLERTDSPISTIPGSPHPSTNHTHEGYTQSDSSETSLNSLQNHHNNVPPLPPKPPKRGILKTPKVSITHDSPQEVETNGYDSTDNHSNLVRNTLQNELITYQNLPTQNGVNGKNMGSQLLVITSTSPSADSLTDTTNSSFATPPFSLSPVGESQGFHRWSRTANFDDINLPLPDIVPLVLPKPRTLTIQRQKPPRNDFGFSLRRAMVLERCPNNANSDVAEVSMRAVIFAEPGTIVQHNNETGLLPGDKLLEVNGTPVEGRTREDIIDLIKASGESVTLKVQPVAELSELSRRSGYDGGEINLDDSNIRGGTLRRSGSRRFNKTATAKTEEHLANEKLWLETEKLWLMHRGGFAASRREIDADQEPGKVKLRLEATGELLSVDEDDVEKANPPQFDRAEDLASLRHLNESSVLHTLRQRYATNLIHTYAGCSTMLVINPMAPLAIYSEKVVSLFKGCKTEDMPPHIYSMAQSSYHAMLSTRRDQSIVFMGRSGSGKTTNFRHCVQYLVTAAGCVNKVLPLEKLSALWTVLESFGNCKTVMNTNATRFTQIFSLDFDQSGVIASASLQVLMLEKVRIAKKIEHETTFHIMQRLLSGIEGNLRKDLFLDNLTGNENNPFITLLQKHEDKQRAQMEFVKVCNALNVLGVTENEQKLLFSVLAAIFHLGCAGAVKAGNNNRYQFANPQSAQRAANLLGTNVEELSRVMFGLASGGMCTPNAPRAPFRTPSPTDKGLDREAVGLEAVEGVIIGLYAEVFNCVASLINRSISASTYTVSSILLVDTPGFQNPATCGRQVGASFEDLCHNYLQERIQLLFHHTNLVAPKDRYLQENIEFTFDENENENFINPTPLVNLLDKTAQNSMIRTSQTDLHEGDRRGLLWLLDEEAIYPGSSDESFLERLFTHYSERDHQLLLRKAPGNYQFIIQHLQGTNPVLYYAKGWVKYSRENPISRAAVTLLQESCKEDLSALFVTVRGLGASSFSGSIVGIDGSQSLRRASSIRRTFTGGAAGIKRKSVCLQTKFTIDGLIETLRRTKLRFVQCILPQHNAGLCESNASLLAVKTTGQQEDALINVPLLRSQIRGGQILDSVRLYKQGFPTFLPLAEFRRKFHLLTADCKASAPVLDERKAVEDMLLALDLELSSYRIGLSQIFFRNGAISQLETQRDERLAGMVVHLQAHCRGYLARKKLAQKKLQDLAVRCIQRNVRKFIAVRDWPWWRLLVRVTPLLNVYRTEEELKIKTNELEAIKQKLEKLESERTKLKHDNDKLEAKLSEMTADLAEEHSTATLAAERLDAETSERLKLEKELSEVQNKNKELQQSSERLEIELLYARSDLNGISEEDEDGDGDGGVYKQRYERAIKELEFTKRRLQQQHEDDLEQLIGLKKQLEKKLADAYEEVEEQRQVVGQWKRKVQKLNGEMNDLKLLLEEQNGRNNLLEKKQRKFDSETQMLQDELKKEKQARDRFAREKEICMAEKYAIESTLADIKLELELKEERLLALQREFDEVTCSGKTEEEVTVLRKQKIDCERRLQDQEEELDELAGQVQLLEQAKLRLEMTLESMRKEAKKEAQMRDEELEEVRCNAHKKVKALEQQLENEHEERTLLLREKHELERRLAAAAELERHDRAGDEALLQRLRRDLKRTKALLRDTQAQLERQKSETAGKATIRQLRNQLEDLECARAVAVKAKQSLETDLLETQSLLEEAHKQKQDAEERANALLREKGDLQTQLEENEEELAEVLKKFKGTVQQMSLDQMALQEQVSLVSELEIERNHLKEQLAELTTKLESVESMGESSSNLLVRRSELKVKELESKLELEQTTRSRLEVQISRLKEAVEKLQNDVTNAKVKEQQAQDQIRKHQRQLREIKEELNKSLAKESEVIIKKKELEKRCELLEAECSTARTDLRLALKRIEDLQSAIQGDLEDTISDNSDSEQETYSSDDSVNKYLSNHKPLSPKIEKMSAIDSRRLSNVSRSSTSNNLGKDPSFT